MFGLDFFEILVIAVVAFLIFGPDEFPVMLRKIAKLLRTIKNLGAQAQQEVFDAARRIEEQVESYELPRKAPPGGVPVELVREGAEKEEKGAKDLSTPEDSDGEKVEKNV